MKFFALFIYRPVATILISLAITLCGILGFRLLPVAPLPQVDFPVIMVSASLPGASPETMASSVATPLERSLGRIAGVNEMTSSSSLGSTRIILEFNFDRDINGAARDVQAAINAAQSLLPSGMPSRPTYRKANPSDAPIMILTLTSDTYSQGELYDFASTQLAQTIAQIDGVGDVDVGGSSLPAVRVDLNPQALFNQGVSLDAVRTAISDANVRKPQGALEDSAHRWQVQTNDELKTAADYQPLIVHYQNGAAVRLGDVATVSDSVQDVRNAGMTNAKPAILLMIRKLPEANIIQTVDSIRARLPELQQTIPAAIDLQISTIYQPLNQYKVVMEVDPAYTQDVSALDKMFVINSDGKPIPLAYFAKWQPANAPLSVNHQGLSAASTISFNLPTGRSLSEASEAIDRAMTQLGVPSSVRGSFAGTAQVFQQTMNAQVILILAAIATVYIVLGVLYESYVHPLTILSTLPSAGVGALLALEIFDAPFSLIALIGIMLLIGIVKKNAIMMVDFALEAQRNGNLTPEEAIFQACLLRFRPIMMTTLAALFGALPLVLSGGDGSELRQPLGITIVGGLVMSQLLTLYTTPVVYLFFDRLRLRFSRHSSQPVSE
ncbi:TPA: hypothetical protein MIS55_19615 [Klebsiella pneumoniae]|nr:hypothetical protein [Klebsiella pneumoniae]HBY2519126.1 hypothetical protein [Klebsiella pneumoniae]